MKKAQLINRTSHAVTEVNEMTPEIQSSPGSPQQFWIDHLVEKHECFHCEMRLEEIQKWKHLDARGSGSEIIDAE